MIFATGKHQRQSKVRNHTIIEKKSVSINRISVGLHLVFPKKILANPLQVKDELWDFRWDMFAMFSYKYS